MTLSHVKAFGNGYLFCLVFALVIITVTQYGLNEPALCWECYTSWDLFVERLYDTWELWLVAIPFFIAYFLIRRYYNDKIL